ncbi:hypothetical protein ACXOES_03200 [Salmonella enterica]|uniref:hypothetical protein n=1 Tax=Salmonella enterica TaxID=28901 RepID=UPI003D281351
MSRDNTSPYSENLRELARIALASLEAEKGADPVVFTDERNLHHIARGRETSLIWGKQNQEVGDIPLYRHAQPVPVVPDEWTIQDAVKFCRETGRQDAGSAMEAWNACRAAMLQGVEQPQNARQNIPENIPDGNSPAIPDDWVMVPRVPTTEMANAMIGVDGCSTSELLVALKLAIAAAPQQEAE